MTTTLPQRTGRDKDGTTVARLPHITAFRFQPFGSRLGFDAVIGLKFPYDAELVALLRDTLAPCHTVAANPEAARQNAGGWLPKHRCWFVEWCAWPQIRATLEAAGYRLTEERPQ